MKEASTTGCSSESSSEDLDVEDFFAAITKPSKDSSSLARTLKAKAQNLLVTWLDGGSKTELSVATFLGEPALMNLFIKFNTAIPSSAAVERLFSTGKEILRARRCQLSDATFETLMFLKGNMHLLQQAVHDPI